MPSAIPAVEGVLVICGVEQGTPNSESIATVLKTPAVASYA
jgi:hypothetical protein